MNYNDDVFINQYPIVKRFVYHLVSYKELIKLYKNHNIASEFWIYTIDAHLLQAAMAWCMVFGAHGSNPTHWWNLSKDNQENIKDDFRKNLIINLKVTEKEWKVYWHSMIDFRDKYVAHKEIGFSKPVPDFAIALKVAYFYDDWIRKIIAPDVFDVPTLKISANFYRIRASNIISSILKYKCY
jgi:hypothetical protein